MNGRRILGMVVGSCLVGSLWIAEKPIAPLPAVASETRSPLSQGLQHYQRGDYRAAIALWEAALTTQLSPIDQARLHTNLAQAYQQVGDSSQAIVQWEAAIQRYRSLKDSAAVARALTDQAQVYSHIGQHPQATRLLESAMPLAQQTRDRAAEAAIHGALGNVQRRLGNYDAAIATYQSGLAIARELKLTAYEAAASGDLGHGFWQRAQRHRYQAKASNLEGDTKAEETWTRLAQADEQQSLAVYQQSVQISRSLGGLVEAQSLLNLITAIAQMNPEQDMTPDYARLHAVLSTLPASVDKAYRLIQFADHLLERRRYEESATYLQQALTITRQLGDRRTESFALGTLGHLYEVQGQFELANSFTQQAQFAAQHVNAADSLYRWQWQYGRLLNAKGKTQEAIAAYERSIATLQGIRSDILAASQDFQFDFRDSVEPVYRELLGLLLDDTSGSDAVKSHAKRPQLMAAQIDKTDVVEYQSVQKAINVLELLKLAELQNFFGDECVQIAKENMKQRSTTLAKDIEAETAIVYSVVLDDRTEIIIQLANGRYLRHRAQALGAIAAQQEVDQLRSLLEKRNTDEYLPQAQRLYDQLIRPIDGLLQQAQVKTLVFIHDGLFRQIPMAALQDGQKFLIEKYAIATTPSLSLTSRSDRSQRRELNALILGLTVEKPPFAALANVREEVTGVQQIIGGTKLLDRAFTLDNLQTTLQQADYPVVHIATHGKFGADQSNTFLLTYDTRMTLEQMDQILRSRRDRAAIELLTLSACETAAGNNRSALGIAGVAIRAGAKSALATLWSINDQATVPLVKEFYRQLQNPNLSKAQALRNAQLSILSQRQFRNYNHPAIWSPFVLVGDWM